jgi:hypothetical protein
MTYTYPVIIVKTEFDLTFLFPDLPSGLESMEEEERDYAPEEVLAEMLLDEEFLPHDLLPKPTPLENIDPEKIFLDTYHLKGTEYQKRDVTVDLDQYID